MSTKPIEKDTIVFQEGDAADTAYFVVSGKIELSEIGQGQAAVLRTVGENEVFGELAVYENSALRPYTAKALEGCEITPITAEEYKAAVEKLSAPLQALLSLAGEKMKQGRSKASKKQNKVITTNIKKISVKPAGGKLEGQVKPMDIPLARLPFRIGGYPEGGEVNRRDTVHLSISSQANPLRVSRQHCEIAIDGDSLAIVDLGSRFCTTVNGTIIGRGRGAYKAPLAMGENEVILGAADSGYKLTVTCE